MNRSADWSQLMDVSGEPYDARLAIKAIASGAADQADEAYDELWERAHHQGDLGTVAYSIVPELVRLMSSAERSDWRAYGLIATIEECRTADGNPPVPGWLKHAYETSMREIIEPALAHLRSAEGDLEVRSLLAVIAHAKGQPSIAAIALWTEDERREALEER